MAFGITKNHLMSAASNFSTAYNLTIISLVLVVSDGIYKETTSQKASIKSAALAGAILGQLTMGYYADLAGRSAAMFLTMSLTIIGALFSSFALQDIWGPAPDPYSWVTFCRFILGIGVGGVYPLAATVAAESSTNVKSRGREVSAVFSTQGLGFIACPLVMLIIIGLNPGTDHCETPYCLLGKKGDGFCNTTSGEHFSKGCGADQCPPPDWKTSADPSGYFAKGCNDYNWRIALALGALPGILMLPFKVSETKKGGEAVRKSTFWSDISKREHWPTLLGTAGGWFLFDITFYGNSLFAPTVTKVVFNDSHPTLVAACWQNAALFAVALPGYWVATYFMDTFGRKNIQMTGFAAMALFYSVLGGLLLKESSAQIGPVGMFIMYSLTFFFSNCGPNSTTFILPSESFPPDVRASLNGLSAAMGKVGATIGASAFKPLANSLAGGGDHGIGAVLLICGCISILGLIVTSIFVVDRRGEAMAGDDDLEQSLVDHVTDEDNYQ